jgi:hypothetical protein
MRTKQLTYNGDNGPVKITVRRGTVGDRLDVDALSWELPDTTSTRERHKQRSFARVVIHSDVEGDLGFPWPTPDASAEDLNVAYSAWKAADGPLWDAWNLALLQVNGEIADPDLVAGNANPKKEATPSA